jgi:hypothetical protein
MSTQPIAQTKPFVYVCRGCHTNGRTEWKYGVVADGVEFGHFQTWAIALEVANRIARRVLVIRVPRSSS